MATGIFKVVPEFVDIWQSRYHAFARVCVTLLVESFYRVLLNQSSIPIPRVLLLEFEVCWHHLFVLCVSLVLKVLSTKQYETITTTTKFEKYNRTGLVVNSALVCEKRMVRNWPRTVRTRTFRSHALYVLANRIGYFY